MKKKRTQYTKYREKLERLLKVCDMGYFSFIEDDVFNEYGNYFLKTIKKEDTFKLYRYMPLYRNIEEDDAIKSVFSLDLENLYLSENGSLNDIFEGLPYSDDYDTYAQDECVEKLINLAYIKCFSETYKNNLMWAHYANSHKGICIEYDICKLTDKNLIKQFFPVHYLKRREMFASVEALMEHAEGNAELEALRDAKGIFLSKSDVWKYEKEWRICHMNHELNKDKFKKIPFDCISAIYMGIRIEGKDIEKVKENLNNYNNKQVRNIIDRIKLYKMKMPSDNSYNLTSEEVYY